MKPGDTKPQGKTRWLELLLHPNLRERASPDTLRRARTTAGIGLFFSLMPVSAVPLFHQHPWDHPFWLTPGSAFLTGILSLLALRWGRPRTSAMILTLGLNLLTIPVLFPLGGIESRSIYWLAFAPLMAMFLLGTRIALFNVFLLISQLGLLFALPSMGVTVPPPTIIDPSQMLIITSLFCTMCFGIGWAFESARRHANDAMVTSMEAQKDLEVARDAAEMAHHSQTQFIATMSHELRTPLNTILGYTELLLEEAEYSPGLEPHQHDIEHIYGSGRHLLRLIDDILTLSALDRGALHVEIEVVDLETMFSKLRATYTPIATAHGNTLDIVRDIDTIESDPRLLELCLTHLLDNACRFTQGGSVTLRAHKHQADVILSVRDTGPGIEAAEQSRIFERFQQLDATSTRVHDGSGLGLAVTRALTRRLGGALTLTSAQGSGADFQLTFSA